MVNRYQQRFKTFEDRFYEKVSPRRSAGCHLWKAATTKGGYGRIFLKGKTLLAHRVAWEMEHGPVPDRLQVLHKCDNRSCVNPDHLFLGTHDDNMADMVAKGRQGTPTGKHHWCGKKTHCKHGHPLDETNTYYSSDGKRQCRTCRRDRDRARYLKKRAQETDTLE